MATSLLALLDDIAAILDDVSVMTKVAAKKTAGVPGDDLALNSQQVAGVAAARATGAGGRRPGGRSGRGRKGKNQGRRPHRLHPVRRNHRHQPRHRGCGATAAADRRAGRHRADRNRGHVPAGGGIVKLDDAGLHLHQSPGDSAFARARRVLGGAILRAAPYLVKGLSIAGTAAMFLVGGGILSHGAPALRYAVESLADRAGAVLGAVVPFIADAVVGIVAGAISLAVLSALGKFGAKD